MKSTLNGPLSTASAHRWGENYRAHVLVDARPVLVNKAVAALGIQLATLVQRTSHDGSSFNTVVYTDDPVVAQAAAEGIARSVAHVVAAL